MNQSDKILFTKIANFITMVKDEKSNLQEKLASMSKKQKLFEDSIEKIGNMLLKKGHFSDKDDQEYFLKCAKENPEVLWKTFQQVSEAAEVSVMGKTASLATARFEDINDSIMIRAGLAKRSSSFLGTI